MKKILFLGFTCKKYDGHNILIDRGDLTRRMSCMETWVQRVTKLGHEVIFFDGDNPVQSYDEKNKFLHLVADDSYDYPSLEQRGIGSIMLGRLREAVSWALKNKEFDFILRTDDGTYINAYMLDEIYKLLDATDVLKSSGGVGGGGIFLSRKACEILVNYTNPNKIKIEDLAVMDAMYGADLMVKSTDLMSHQYVLSEKLFTIHYANGKRMYSTDDVISYYYQGIPIKRKVIINYPLNYVEPLRVNTWESSFERTPYYYSFDKDDNNWEHYGYYARSSYCVQCVCPLAPKSIDKLILWDIQFDINKPNEKQSLLDYIDSVMEDGKCYLYYSNDVDLNNLKKVAIISNGGNVSELDIPSAPNVQGKLYEIKKRDINKIVVAQYWTSNLSYGKFTKAINEKYCKENDYRYHVETDDDKINQGREDRAYTWWKPKFLLEVFETYNPKYVLFLDADAVIDGDDCKIEQFIDPNFDIIATEDHGPSKINAGVLLINNTEWSKQFLNDWWNICEEYPQYKTGLWHDQTGFGLLLDKLGGAKQNIKIISNRELNWRNSSDSNFIFHAFAFGSVPNRTIDTLYYKKFNIEIPMDNMNLSEISNFYNSDKRYNHNYFNRVYNELLGPLKGNISLFVELGVFNGDSLGIWKKYFDCRVIGVDYQPCKSVEGCEIVIYDLSKETELEKLSNFVNGADVILDDASHKMADQQRAFAVLFKAVKSGGIFIIEDLHTSVECSIPSKSWCNWGDPTKTTTLFMLKNYIETGKIKSDYMSEEEIRYLEDNIQSCKIYDEKVGSITSYIIKK